VYAIVKTGGKQYRVATGEVVRFEALPGEVGTTLTLSEVLLVSDDAGTQVGAPLLTGATVTGTVVEQGRGGKVKIFKYKKRKHYRRTKGHRQGFTAVRIDAVKA
jgi:large subunit ribosomal protein L21